MKKKWVPTFIFALLIFFFIPLTLPNVNSQDKMDKPEQSQAKDELSGLIEWMESHQVLVGIFLTMGGAAGSALTGIIIHLSKSQAQAGRERFMNVVSEKIIDDVSEIISAEINPIKESIVDIKNTYKELNIKISNVETRFFELSSDVKVLSALRQEFIHKLERNLRKADEHIADILSAYLKADVDLSVFKCDLDDKD